MVTSFAQVQAPRWHSDVLFDTPAVLITDIGMMDIDEKKPRMRISFLTGVTETFTYVGLSDNAVQRIILSKPNVVRVDVVFPGTGAITQITFCPECRPQETSDSDHHCIIAGQKVVKAELNVSSIDFTDSSKAIALRGWMNGKLTSSIRNTTFLDGKLGEGDAPYKMFMVKKNAETMIFDLDFSKFKLSGVEKSLGGDLTFIHIEDGGPIHLEIQQGSPMNEGASVVSLDVIPMFGRRLVPG